MCYKESPEPTSATRGGTGQVNRALYTPHTSAAHGKQSLKFNCQESGRLADSSTGTQKKKKSSCVLAAPRCFWRWSDLPLGVFCLPQHARLSHCCGQHQGAHDLTVPAPRGVGVGCIWHHPFHLALVSTTHKKRSSSLHDRAFTIPASRTCACTRVLFVSCKR